MTQVCLYIHVCFDNAPCAMEYIILTEDEVDYILNFVEKKKKENNYFQERYCSKMLTYYYNKIEYKVYRENDVINSVKILSTKESDLGHRIGSECLYGILLANSMM